MSAKKHSVETAKHDLELDEDIGLHERGWRWQKLGWGLLILLVIAGALGAFGEGILSTRKPSSNGITLRYDRFFRYQHEMQVLVQSQVGFIHTISLPQQYLEKMLLVRMVPEPIDNVAQGDRVTFRFVGTHKIISIYEQPEDAGSIDGLLLVNDSARFLLSHFIYP